MSARDDVAELDPAGAEWERITRAALAIHYDWTKRERQAIEDFILTVRHSIADVYRAKLAVALEELKTAIRKS